jgi:hypothetical protein
MGRKSSRKKLESTGADRKPRSPEPARASAHAEAGWVASPAMAITAVLFVIACVIPSTFPAGRFPPGAITYWTKGGIGVAIAALILAGIRARFFQSLPARMAAVLMAPSARVYAAVIGIITVAASAGIAEYSFSRAPTTSDEIAQLWHARILLTGRLSLPADANPEFFAIDNVVDTGRWYSQYPIGGPLVLAAGLLVGLAWLVNPLLAGGAAALLYHFGRVAFGELQGRAIGALFAVTPMILMMSGTYMNHVPVLFLACASLAALVEWDRAQTMKRATIFAGAIGLAVGGIVTIRPLDAVVVAIVVGVFQLAALRRNPAHARSLVAQLVTGSVCVALLLFANAATTGSALRFGYDVMWGAAHQIGFHVDPQGTLHSPERGLQYAVTFVRELTMFPMLWPIPAIVLLIAGLVSIRRASRWDHLLLGFMWLQILAYSAYWYWGQFLGPRFFFTALPAVIVLLARTPFLIGDRYGAFARRFAVFATVGCVYWTWLPIGGPYTAPGMARDLRNTRRGLKLDMHGTVRRAELGTAVVFLREPFGQRLLRRLWGIGMSRSDAAQLLARRDACSLLAAVRAVENDPAIPRDQKPAAVARMAAPYAPSGEPVRTADISVRISSTQTLTPECRAEFDDDARYGGASFGPLLPFEPINSEGRIDGDVVYVADLSDRNEVLRARFGNRKWYRLATTRVGDRTTWAEITPY